MATDTTTTERSTLLSRCLKQRRFVVGLVLVALVFAIALFGRFVAPYGETELVAPTFTNDGASTFLGTDYLGHDVLSRVLYGGFGILWVSAAATALGLFIGIVVGLVAAYAGGWLDEILMRLNDVMLAFPQILLALIVLSAVEQPKAWMLIILVGITHAPRVARLVRGSAITVVSRDFVVSAEALGESRLRILGAEILPQMTAPLLAEAGLRLTYSIGMIAGLGFLGFATDPEAADWGLMINENRLGLLVQPWGVLAPVILIGVFTVGINLMADAITKVTTEGEAR